MVVQLALIGVVLKFIFAQTSPAWTRRLRAGHGGRPPASRWSTRQHRRLGGWQALGFSTATLLFIGTAVTALGVGVIIGPDPWYAPRYVLPILGMVLGNTMTAVSLVLDTFSEAARRERGGDRGAAGARRAPLRGAERRAAHVALRTGMTPILNSMATTGIVALPGMMTGQILAGADPVGGRQVSDADHVPDRRRHRARLVLRRRSARCCC